MPSRAGPDINLVSHELGYIYRPVSRGWMKAESLFDGAFDLDRVVEINEMIDIFDENERRITEHMRNVR